jgi:hypothetical protein
MAITLALGGFPLGLSELGAGYTLPTRPVIFDASTKRIILSTNTITATEIYSAWVDWASLTDNIKYLPAFSAIGGDDLGGGLSIPPYYFLQNNWRVRPMEANQTLTITGNLFVSGGGDPIVPTLGTFNVLVKSVVPVQAQGIATGGGGSSITAADVWNYINRSLTTAPSSLTAADVRAELAVELARIDAPVSSAGGALDATQLRAALQPELSRIDAPVSAAGSPSAIASRVRVELAPELARIDVNSSEAGNRVLIAQQVRQELSAELGRIDIPVSQSLGSTLTQGDIRTALAPELARIDTNVSYTVGSTLTSQQVRAELAVELSRIDGNISGVSHLTQADVRSILPEIARLDVPVSTAVVTNAATVASYVRTEIATELSMLDVPVSSRAASTDVIKADIRKVNNIPLYGTGSDSDPWRNTP